MQNVKAYLRRGAARESLGLHTEALQGLATTHQPSHLLYMFLFFLFLCLLMVKPTDFKHALVLEPQNKAAGEAEKRLLKLIR